MTKLTSVGTEIRGQTSPQRSEHLKTEIDILTTKVTTIREQTTSRIEELSELNQRWTTFYERLERFSSWLAEKETHLSDVRQSESLPEEQLKQVEVRIELLINRFACLNLPNPKPTNATKVCVLTT